MTEDYRICTRCIMDVSDPQITFDGNGVCNHCKTYAERARTELHYDEAGQVRLKQIVDKMRREGERKRYDSVVGVSGGIDSTFLAYTAHRLGLRPLAVHLDNGWDTEVSLDNVRSVTEKLEMDLYMSKVDWPEFRGLQRSFLESSISNCEIPTDHAIVAFLYRTALKEGVRYLIGGGNITSEAVVPRSWGYTNRDWKLIEGVHRRFGGTELKRYDHMSNLDWIYITQVKRIKYVPLLNYVPYYKQDAKRIIMQECGWKDYGAKHHESVFTRFFQCHILPAKFGIDKRRVHLSNLIWSGQMSREAALEEMKKRPYPTDEMLTADKEYVVSRLGLGDGEFERLMAKPVKEFSEYPNSDSLYTRLGFFLSLARKMATSP